jgi:hypothetical protein
MARPSTEAQVGIESNRCLIGVEGKDANVEVLDTYLELCKTVSGEAT